MEVRFKPDTQLRLDELASRSGRATDELLEDALVSYLLEIGELRDGLDRRYDDIESGRVAPVDGEAFFEGLRQRADQRLGRLPSK